MKNVVVSILIIFLMLACNEPEIKRESILDNIVHLEDSIYYRIDSLPMLCDELNMDKQFIDIGDCRLYCEVSGKGTPLVLINGGPGGTHHCFHPWFKQAERFAKVIYYDQRGCGQSDFIRSDGYTFRQAIDDLDKLRDKLGIEKWVVCGYSYGGALAQYYTATYPEHVMGMVLIGSAPLLHDDILKDDREYDFMSIEERQRIREIYAMYNNGELNMLQLLFNKEINGDWKRQTFYKPTNDEVIRLSLYEWVNDKGFNGEVGSSYQRYDFKGVFENNPIPTLICEGKWDLTWVAAKATILSNNHPNGKLVIFENAGHTIFSEETALFFKTLRNFMKELKPTPLAEVTEWKSHAAALILPQEEFFETERNFINLLQTDGIDEAYTVYKNVVKDNEGKRLFSEKELNKIGYRDLRKNDFESAIKIFNMNAEAYPDSWNVYDCLGEAYFKKGDKNTAKKYYQQSLELNPENKTAIKAINEIG